MVPSDVLEALAFHESAEPTAAYLEGRLSGVDMFRSDLGALRGWSVRWQLVREHLFPPATYMRERYAVSGSVPLAALYAHRAGQGAWKWFRRPSRGSS